MILHFTIFAIVTGLVPLLFSFAWPPGSQYKAVINGIRPLLIILFISVFYELIASFWLKLPSGYWFRLYTLLEFLSLCYFFRLLFKNRYNILLYLFIFLFTTCYCVLLTLWGDHILNLETDAYLAIIETIFVYVFVILWFKELFHNANVESLLQSPVFYFICSFILYFSGTVFLFLLSSTILQGSKEAFRASWLINVVLSLVMRILIVIGIWKARKV